MVFLAFCMIIHSHFRKHSVCFCCYVCAVNNFYLSSSL